MFVKKFKLMIIPSLLFSVVAFVGINTIQSPNNEVHAAAKITGSVPTRTYFEQKWSGGKWVTTYSNVISYKTISYSKSYSYTYVSFNEHIWYNLDGSYNNRTFYRNYTYTLN